MRSRALATPMLLLASTLTACVSPPRSPEEAGPPAHLWRRSAVERDFERFTREGTALAADGALELAATARTGGEPFAAGVEADGGFTGDAVSDRTAWGTVLDVPGYSQMLYPEGWPVWCSPTSTTMLLGYWGQKLGRPELRTTVPASADRTYDWAYACTGNWTFNTACGQRPEVKFFQARTARPGRSSRFHFLEEPPCRPHLPSRSPRPGTSSSPSTCVS